MNAPFVFDILPFDEITRPNPEQLPDQWTTFWARLEPNTSVRMISSTYRFDLSDAIQPLVRLDRTLQQNRSLFRPFHEVVLAWDDETSPARLRQLFSRLPDAWKKRLPEPPRSRLEWVDFLRDVEGFFWKQPWIQDQVRAYQHLQDTYELRGMRHRMMVWLPPGADPHNLIVGLSEVLQTRVTPGSYTPLVMAQGYREELLYLEPPDRFLPFITCLTSYDLTGWWDTRVLKQILSIGNDVAIAVDVRTMNPFEARQKAEFNHNSLRLKIEGGEGRDNPHLMESYQGARQMLKALENQTIHEVRIVVAVMADSPRSLDQIVTRIEQRVGSRMKLIRTPGDQAGLVRFFSGRPTKSIAADTRPKEVLSQNVATMMMAGYYLYDGTKGFWWMMQGDTPVFFSPFAHKRPAHAMIVGETGSGKTTAVWCLVLRMLTQGVRVIILEPQGHARKLTNAIREGGAHLTRITEGESLNILDPVVTRGEEGEPPALGQQIEYVIQQLSMILATSEPGEGISVAARPRLFTPLERGYLDQALEQVYAPFDLATLLPSESPILSDVIAVLQTLREPFSNKPAKEAIALAHELQVALLSGSRRVFNQRTSMVLDFQHPLTAFDLENISDGSMRAFYNSYLVRAINRYVKDPRRYGYGGKEPLVVVIDEFAAMAQRNPVLKSFAAVATKTWRTHGAFLWMMDQDFHTWLGPEGTPPDPLLYAAFLNTQIRMVFRQQPSAAQRIVREMPGLYPWHAEMMTRQGKGEYILAWTTDDRTSENPVEVFTGYLQRTHMETHVLEGT